MLVNQGIRVLFTTHSPYLIDHVNNLIEASQLNPAAQAEVATRFMLRTTDAFLGPAAVSAYLFQENGEVRRIYDEVERRIDWSTFSNVSDSVGYLYSYLLAAAQKS